MLTPASDCGGLTSRIDGAGSVRAHAARLADVAFEAACRRAAYGVIDRVARDGEAAAEAIARIATPWIARAKSGRKPRRELIAGTARDWAVNVPALGRLGDLHIHKDA